MIVKQRTFVVAHGPDKAVEKLLTAMYSAGEQLCPNNSSKLLLVSQIFESLAC